MSNDNENNEHDDLLGSIAPDDYPPAPDEEPSEPVDDEIVQHEIDDLDDDFESEFEDELDDVEVDEDDPVVDRKAGKKDLTGLLINGALGLVGVGAAAVVYVMFFPGSQVTATPQNPIEFQSSIEPISAAVETEVVAAELVDPLAAPVDVEPAPEPMDDWQGSEMAPAAFDAQVLQEVNADPALSLPMAAPEPMVDSLPVMVAPSVSTAEFDAVLDRLAMTEAKLDKMAGILVEAGSKISTLEAELRSTKTSLKALKKQKAKAKAVKVKKAASTVNKTVSKHLTGYTVQSMVNNKVWLLYKGQRHVLGLGDKVPNGGRIVALDLPAQQVLTTHGVIK